MAKRVWSKEQLAEFIKNFREENKKVKKYPKTKYGQIKQWRETNPLKTAAHRAVFIAVRNGSLLKQRCIFCDSTKTQAHHEDYSKPLDVIWFCKRHHVNRHIELRKKLCDIKKMALNKDI